MKGAVIPKTRTVNLLTAVLSKIKFEPQVFVDFVKILETEPSLTVQAYELVLCYQSTAASPTSSANTPPISFPTDIPHQSSKPPGGLEDKIARMEKNFEELVDSVEESFVEKVPLEKVQTSLKHIPVSLKTDLGKYFHKESLEAESIKEFFFVISHYWDYLNPGLLEFLVGRFGTNNDKALLNTYLEKLEQFRSKVKLGDYVKSRQRSIKTSTDKKITSIMGPGWEDKTLQDAEDFKNEFADECHIQQFLPRIRANHSSIALIVYVPRWFEVEKVKLELFFRKQNVRKVYLDDVCFIDWTEQAMKKFKDQLNCSVCLGVYNDPKMLHCLHAFCQTCLVRLVFRDEQGQLVLSCPNCRHITPVPANGVAGLQPAFLINHLLDIAEDLKRGKDAPASAERADSSSASLPPPQEEVTTFCSEHAKEEMKLYCETCGELICFHCTLKTGKHHNHDCTLIEEAFDAYKKEIGSLLEPINRKVASVDEVLTQFDKDNGEISDQRAAIEADIHDTINELHQVLDVRRTELISRLHQLTQRKLKDLAAERDQAETVHAQLSSCQDYMKQSIRTDRWGEALKMKTTVLKQVKELTTTVQPDALKPNTKADTIFSASADITDLCRQYGQVSTPGSPDPSKCHATGKGLDVGIVGQTSTAVLQVCNSKCEPCTEPVTSLECKLVSDLTGATATGSFKKLEGQNRYEISYQPTIKGRHQLHISIQGQPIRESPFHPAVTSSVTNLGAPIHTIAGVDYPWGIAINHKGEIVVSERHIGHISTYTHSGKKINTKNYKTIYLKGLELFGLELFGLTLDREGNIIVAEEINNSIRKYSPEGQLLVSVGTKGTGRLQFHMPRDIAINTGNNKVYVADFYNHRIQVLNSDLTFSTSFGKHGEGKGQFDCPSGITCDCAGNVYVADTGNHRVQVFTAEGIKFLRMFGKRGKGRGELDRPIGIALDPSSKYVYISESNNHRISVFTCEGQFVTSFGADIEGLNPRGLAVDFCGVVYVCDFSTNDSIHIF